MNTPSHNNNDADPLDGSQRTTELPREEQRSPNAGTNPADEIQTPRPVEGVSNQDEVGAPDPVDRNAGTVPVVAQAVPVLNRRHQLRAVLRHRVSHLVAAGLVGIVIGGGTMALIGFNDGDRGCGHVAQVVSGDSGAGGRHEDRTKGGDRTGNRTGRGKNNGGNNNGGNNNRGNNNGGNNNRGNNNGTGRQS